MEVAIVKILSIISIIKSVMNWENNWIVGVILNFDLSLMINTTQFSFISSLFESKGNVNIYIYISFVFKKRESIHVNKLINYLL